MVAIFIRISFHFFHFFFSARMGEGKKRLLKKSGVMFENLLEGYKFARLVSSFVYVSMLLYCRRCCCCCYANSCCYFIAISIECFCGITSAFLLSLLDFS